MMESPFSFGAQMERPLVAVECPFAEEEYHSAPSMSSTESPGPPSIWASTG